MTVLSRAAIHNAHVSGLQDILRPMVIPTAAIQRPAITRPVVRFQESSDLRAIQSILLIHGYSAAHWWFEISVLYDRYS